MPQVQSRPVDLSIEYLNAAYACAGAAAAVLGALSDDASEDAARSVAFEHLTDALSQLLSARADKNGDLDTVLYKARRDVQAVAAERARLAFDDEALVNRTNDRFHTWAAVHLLARAARSLLKAAGPTAERRKGEEADGLLSYVLQEPNAHLVALVCTRLRGSDVEAVEEAALSADYNDE